MQIITIEENDANQRLDKFLKKYLVNATLSLIYKFNRKGKIKVQQIGDEGFKKRENEFKILLGDKIKFFLSDNDLEELTKVSEEKTQKTEELVGHKFDKRDIVFEDEELFVVNKQSGMNVHPGDFKSKEVSLIQQVQDYLGEKMNSLTFKPSLIHRIDRDTSGIIMIAKKKDILSKLVNDFKTHNKIKKTYLAICFGNPPQTSGTISKKLLRIEGAKKENKVQLSDKGQIAISHYSLVNQYSIETDNRKQNISVIEVEIETGRMHQIRVHLASIKCPIIGDKSYGNKSLNYYFEKKYNISRQMLHAYKIEFFHYGVKKMWKLQADMKQDMKDFLGKLK